MKGVSVEILIANIVSWVFNPFFVLPISIIISNLNEINTNPFPFLMFSFVGGAPMLFYYLYVEYQHKESPWQFFISIPRVRRNPLLLMGVYTFFFNAVIFSYLHQSFWVSFAILGTIFCGLLYLVNKYIDKASWHAAGLAFSIFYIADRLSLAYAFLLILLPLVYWARIKLHKHTWVQLFLGTVVGMIIGLLSWLI